ncbi:MAG: hypothetical protein ABI666_06010 [Ferruginibacter sp.]
MWLPKGSYGTKTGRVKKYSDHHQPCKSCKAFDMEIRVYQDYYHFLFIPFFAKPGKTASMRCNNCGEPVLTRAILQEYETKTKTAFYLFSGLILIGALVILVSVINVIGQKEKEKLVADPHVGDVYTITNPKIASYYFLRLSKIKADTILAWKNNYMYYNRASMSEKDDYFDSSNTIILTKKSIRQMMDNNEIYSVDRGYDDSRGFNRIN